MLNHLKDPATNPLHAAPMAIVGCEFSGATRQRLRGAGLNAWSCDLLEAEDGSPFHLQGDILGFLQLPWTLGIFHPPCTYLSSSGLHWNTRRAGRAEKTESAVAFARLLIEADIPLVAVENPVGCLSTRARKPEQIIHKMVDGRVGKYYEENCLLQQAFVKENKVSVEQHIAAVAKELGGEIKLVKYVRFEKGEGIEKKQDDFAAEVASMTK